MQKLIANFCSRTPPRTGSLLVTVFGDCVAPRGGQVWLGNLINVVEPLGLSHRLVRTAVYRLVNDSVLTNTQVGRRSFYSLTDIGQKQFADATQRIYAARAEQWHGQWHIALTHQAAQRIEVQRQLKDHGYGIISPDCFAHPHPERTQRLIGEMPGLISMQATLDEVANQDVHDLVANAWPLESLSKSYLAFIELFESYTNLGQYSDEEAFYLRTFLIHEFRRVLLRDPGLPDELLAKDWPGHTARELAKTIYQDAVTASERFIDAQFVSASGPMPQPSRAFYERFA